MAQLLLYAVSKDSSHYATTHIDRLINSLYTLYSTLLYIHFSHICPPSFDLERPLQPSKQDFARAYGSFTTLFPFGVFLVHHIAMLLSISTT